MKSQVRVLLKSERLHQEVLVCAGNGENWILETSVQLFVLCHI